MIGEPSIDMSMTPPQDRSIPEPADHRHHRHAALADVFDDRKISALGIAVVAVDIAAEHQAAFVGLAHVEMSGSEGDDAGNQRLERLRYKRLQDVAFDRKPQPRHLGDVRAIPGHRDADLFWP